MLSFLVGLVIGVIVGIVGIAIYEIYQWTKFRG